jgi:non-specific serine/threonine protein kinase/serine/threonine-protein kinase
MDKTGQWERVKELFDAALERDPADRDLFLNSACGSDSFLREEIESLLSAYARSDGLSQPAVAIAGPEEAEPHEFIGPYKLIRKIGEGGMGQVWLAEQAEPLRRQVALKLIRSGAFDDSLLRRFQSERQSLALMDHPAIAKVFDAGATPEGQPYFVMEYVPGEPITRYCDAMKLTIPERLELFIRVCEGVQHAHQKAIIHRDLKPANILVLEVDGKPTPRLIDFGLAKAAAPLVPGDSAFTGVWGIAGTPGYISPEQAAARDIDTRTDVYSLGIVLYELLTGVLPFDTENWSKQPLDEVLRQLREQDPPRPSARVAAQKNLSVSAAELRATEPKHLAGLLHGDLDSIAMKAIEKDRDRRYGTPSELAADIARYLEHEPVLARRAGAAYRLRKYIRRHRVAVGVAASLVILLTAFAVLEAVQLRRITEERDRTARERDRANRIADFMTGMFKVSDPSQSRGNSVTAREVLDKASAQIETGLANDPQMQAQLMSVMGIVYDNLGLYPRAVDLLTRSSAIGPPDSPPALQARAALGKALYHAGQYARGADVLRATYADDLRVFGPRSRDTTKVMDDLGYALYLQGAHLAEAESLIRQAIQIQQSLLGPDDHDTLRTRSDLGTVLMYEGKLQEAEQVQRQALADRARVLGPEDVDTIASMNNLATTLIFEKKYPEAESLLRRVFDLRTHLFGSGNEITMATLNNLAVVLRHEGRLAESAALQQKSLDFYRRVQGPANPRTLIVQNNLAATWAQMGQYGKAEQLLKQARNAQIRVSPDDSGTAITTYNLAGVYAREGRRNEALAFARQAIDHGLPPLADIGMATDPDFKPLFGDPRFITLAAYAKQKAAESQSEGQRSPAAPQSARK